MVIFMRFVACQITLDVIPVHSGDLLMVLLSPVPGMTQTGSSTPQVR